MALVNAGFIGAYFVHGWNGTLAVPQYNSDSFARMGQIGSGSQIVGKRGRDSEINCWIAIASRDEAIRVGDALEAYQALTVRMGDDLGRVFQRVRIKIITVTRKASRGPIISGTTQSAYRINIRMVCEVLP